MNDLLSQTFSSHANMDLESGPPQTELVSQLQPQKDLAQFFEVVGSIKTRMQTIRDLLHKLQDAHEEGKTITKSQAVKALRDRMDKDVEEVLKKAKGIKISLEELDRANIANRKIPGCEEGTSTDRTRMSITNSLRKNLKELMEDFQALRQKMMNEYKETVERRYYTVTGEKPDEETVDQMIRTGESETILKKAIEEQGRGQITETIREIQERHDAVKEIEKHLLELHQIFLDMAVLVEAQGEQLDNIEAAVKGASSFVERGTQQLHAAKKLQRNSRKWTCIGLLILLIILIVVLVPVLTTVLKK